MSKSSKKNKQRQVLYITYNTPLIETANHERICGFFRDVVKAQTKVNEIKAQDKRAYNFKVWNLDDEVIYQE